MIASSLAQLAVSVVLVAQLVLCQRLLQPSFHAHHQHAGLFSPSTQGRRQQAARRVSAWDHAPSVAPEPRHSARYSNHRDDHAPEASHSEQFSEPSWGGADESSHDGARVHFHVSGHKGPKSYRFGYDTGKGKARHFRYEERDGAGVVHGRYGYHDKHGQLHVFHYTAHPHHGYQAKEVDPHTYG